MFGITIGQVSEAQQLVKSRARKHVAEKKWLRIIRSNWNKTPPSDVWTRQRQRQEDRRLMKADKAVNVSGLEIPERKRGGLLLNPGEVYK